MQGPIMQHQMFLPGSLVTLPLFNPGLVSNTFWTTEFKAQHLPTLTSAGRSPAPPWKPKFNQLWLRGGGPFRNRLLWSSRVPGQLKHPECPQKLAFLPHWWESLNSDKRDHLSTSGARRNTTCLISHHRHGKRSLEGGDPKNLL